MCKSASVYHIFFATATTNRHLFAKIKIGDGFSIVKNRHLFKKSRLGDGLLWRKYFCDCRAETTVSINIRHKPEEPVCWLLVGWKSRSNVHPVRGEVTLGRIIAWQTYLKQKPAGWP
jgi:hypothetical protein